MRYANLTTAFRTERGEVTAVEEVSFDVDEGEILGIVGESGSGKSVTALTIMGLLPQPPARIAGGTIRFAGEELTTKSETQMERIRGSGISMVFQEPMTSLNPVFTIGEQMMETMRAHERLSPREQQARAISMLDRVGIPSAAQRMQDYPHQLSGGQRQRVMIAIALACNPKLLIADEPTTALDVTIQAQMLDLLMDLRDEFGMAIIIITHNMGVIAETADRVLVMYAGRVVEQAPGGRAVRRAARHPYTRGLLACVPTLEQDHDRLVAIPGIAARADAPAAGLPLRTALPLPIDACRAAIPPLVEYDTGHARRLHPRARTLAGAGEPRMSNLIEISGLSKHFPVRTGGVLRRVTTPLRAVDDVSLSIAAGETLGLVGESGCGKSTLGRLLIRLIEPTGGTIRFDGTEITGLTAKAMRTHRRAMQIVFQDPYGALNPRMIGGGHHHGAAADPWARNRTRRAGARWTRCSSSSGCRPVRATAFRTSSPAASASAWASPGRWCCGRAFWCATSRSRRWTYRCRRRS